MGLTKRQLAERAKRRARGTHFGKNDPKRKDDEYTPEEEKPKSGTESKTKAVAGTGVASMGLVELKAEAEGLGITNPNGDKRMMDTWKAAIAQKKRQNALEESNADALRAFSSAFASGMNDSEEESVESEGDDEDSDDEDWEKWTWGGERARRKKHGPRGPYKVGPFDLQALRTQRRKEKRRRDNMAQVAAVRRRRLEGKSLRSDRTQISFFFPLRNESEGAVGAGDGADGAGDGAGGAGVGPSEGTVNDDDMNAADDSDWYVESSCDERVAVGDSEANESDDELTKEELQWKEETTHAHSRRSQEKCQTQGR